MRKMIGVADEDSLVPLKRWLLLVDEIAVVHDLEADWTFRDKKPTLAADLDWLTARGVVSRVNAHVDSTVNAREVKFDGKRVILIPKSGEAAINILPRPTNSKSNGLKTTVRDLLSALQDIVCRQECETLRELSGVDAVSLHQRSPSGIKVEGVSTVMADIHHVIVKALPEPSETTPLERILDFKADPETRSKRLGLRRWMTSLTKGSMSQQELSDELEWLLNEYETYMRIQKLKIRKGICETVIVGTAEVAENFAKLKFSKIAEMPFEVSKRRAELLNAELAAPGREIAYIDHAKSSFEKHR